MPPKAFVFTVKTLTTQELAYYPMSELSLDELCQIHNSLITQLSNAFHESDNVGAAYLALICDRYMAEIKNRILYTAI